MWNTVNFWAAEQNEPPPSSPKLKTGARQDVMVVAFLTIIGLCIRLYAITIHPLWYDEIETWYFSHQSIHDLLGNISYYETNPPFYYIIIKFIVSISDSPVMLRLPSALAGTLVIPLIYMLGRVGKVPRAGVMGAFFATFSATLLWYSSNARAYPFAVDSLLVSAIGVVLVVQHRFGGDRMRRKGWLCVSVGALSGFYFHYTFVLEIAVLQIPLSIALFTARSHRSKFFVEWAVSSTIVAMGMAWGLKRVFIQSKSSDISWIQPTSPASALDILCKAYGFYIPGWDEECLSLIFISFMIIISIIYIRKSESVMVCAAIFIIFPLILFIISIHRPIFIERVLVPSSVAILFISGYACTQVGPLLFQKILATTLAVLMFLSAVNRLEDNTLYKAYSYETAIQFLQKHVSTGDMVVGTDGIAYYRYRMGANLPFCTLRSLDRRFGTPCVGKKLPLMTQDDFSKLALTDHTVFIAVNKFNIGSGKSAHRVLDENLKIYTIPLFSSSGLEIDGIRGSCIGKAPCI